MVFTDKNGKAAAARMRIRMLKDRAMICVPAFFRGVINTCWHLSQTARPPIGGCRSAKAASHRGQTITSDRGLEAGC
jgi:hypothetical protein